MPSLQVTACISGVEAGLLCMPFCPTLQSLGKLLIDIYPSLTRPFCNSAVVSSQEVILMC